MCLTQKVVHFGSPSLQYQTGTKFFHRAVPELHNVRNCMHKPMTTAILEALLRVLEAFLKPVSYAITAASHSSVTEGINKAVLLPTQKFT